MKIIDKKVIQKQLIKHGLDPLQIQELHFKIKTKKISYDSFVYKASQLRAPKSKDFNFFKKIDTQKLKIKGISALKKDELLVFWLNGGAATRYFDQTLISKSEKKRFSKELKLLNQNIIDLPKGVTPVYEGMSYLELKIRNLLKITREYKLKKHPYVLLMNSFITDKPTKEHLKTLYKKYPELILSRFHFIVQRPIVPRFKKVVDLNDVELFVDQKGHLSFSPAGHGDFLYLTQEYLSEEKITGAKYMFFSNIDNFGSGIDPLILGYHIKSKKGRTVEVAKKDKGDKGGAPCWANKQMVIVEQMKFPKEFNQDKLKYFNTNNFYFTLRDLMDYEDELPLIIAHKNIPEGEVLQLEHFACDVNLISNYLVVPRELRFWPTKRYIDLLKYLYPDKKNKAEMIQAKKINQILKINY
ncbi:MAG: UTP--glucose-1-phosphate uridylyltransferase [Patescibacteria group bacterium]